MNDLDIFRRARPDVSPLDSDAAEQIRLEVFGAEVPRSVRRWSRPRVFVAALAVASAAALMIAATRGDPTRSISPASSTTHLTSASTVVTTTSDAAITNDWRLHPAVRFQPSPEWTALFEQARDANIGRCMTAAGFQYHGKPFETDGEVADAAPDIQPGTYEAAYFGVGAQGNGCLDRAYATIFGSVRSDVAAQDVMTWASGEWRRAAFADPEVLAALEVLATCARGHGVEVRDVGSAPSKALNDIDRGMSQQTVNDPRLADVQATTPAQVYVHTLEEMQAVAHVVQNEWCATFTAFDNLFENRSEAAAVVWIDDNPNTMAGVDAQFAEDVERFRYIIGHQGEVPA